MPRDKQAALPPDKTSRSFALSPFSSPRAESSPEPDLVAGSGVPCCGFHIRRRYIPPASSYGGVYGGNTPTSVAAPAVVAATTTVTGTFFGYRCGRVGFRLHDTFSSRPTAPLLLLEFTVPTTYFAREMQHGLLRIYVTDSKYLESYVIMFFLLLSLRSCFTFALRFLRLSASMKLLIREGNHMNTR
ncbi:protein MIZU-KUSSEI 1-like [Canna indica]|uniref:Protein MIZU-KUSSEI 1-like n=1 Tax=Canna indica TaxID=4628 RepID=A0AAQ3KT42_9LILI|nr:protein MIZU-KUSSEI 1-like [Canna indica]